MSWYVRFLEAMQKNDPSLLHEDVSRDKQYGLGLSFQRFSRNFQRGSRNLDLDFRPAVTCPAGMCQVGFFRNGQPGFVEVIGPLDNLRTIRLVYPLFGSNPDAVLSGEVEKGRILSLALFQFLLSNALDVPKGSQDQAKILAPFKDLVSIAQKCGAISLNSVYKDRRIVVTTMNPDFWVNVEIMPLHWR
jgi:hypothetical protein